MKKDKKFFEINPSKIIETLSYHPTNLCRFKTIMNGVLNKKRPGCWYKRQVNFQLSRKYLHFKKYSLMKNYSKLNELIPLLICNQKKGNDTDYNGNTPLHFSAYLNNLKVTKMLIKNKWGCGDINQLNYLKNSPLHVAVKSNSNEVLRFFVNKGAKVKFRPEGFIDPLYLSLTSQNKSGAKIILSYYEKLKRSPKVASYLEEIFIEAINWGLPEVSRELRIRGLVRDEAVLRRGRSILKEMRRKVL